MPAAHPRRLAMLALLPLALACPQSVTVEEPAPPPIAPGTRATRVVDASGEILGLEGLTLTIPAGALEEPTEISIVATDRSAPEPFHAFSPLFRFEPSGLEFAVPVTVTLPFDGEREIATVFWTERESDAFSARPTETEGYFATATIHHFSQGFVGTACNDCCGRATDALDVLLMVDNSGSMSEEQASLAAEIPRLVEALATGDVNGDGIQDFPVVSDLRIGVVTSDMGTGPAGACGSTFGDDGVLLDGSLTGDPGCAPSGSPWVDGEGTVVESFSAEVSCLALVGTAGCGFEQQLEASLKALTPMASSIRFMESSTGHGTGANAGFVRDGAVLAIVNLTDEDDCTAVDAGLYEMDHPAYDPNLNLRCFTHPEVIQPVSRYVDGYLALKNDPNQLVFATIAGVPADLEGQPHEAILSDPRMVERPNPDDSTQLIPSCEAAGRGRAFPPRRLVTTAQGLEARGAKSVITSICNSSFESAVSAILERVAAGVSGSCG